MLRKCSKCNRIKEESEFYLRSDGFGYRSYCKSCFKENSLKNKRICRRRKKMMKKININFFLENRNGDDYILNFTIDGELRKLKEEFDKRFLELEKKYEAVLSYKVVPAILDKLNIDYLELDMNDVNKNDSVFIVDFVYQDNKIIVQKQKNTDEIIAQKL